MYMRNGIVSSCPIVNPKKTPKVITSSVQRTAVLQSTRRLDNLMKGKVRICIHRSLGGLGDIIMATPIFRGARKKWPEAHTTFAVPTSYANGDVLEYLRYNPYIDEVIDFSLVNRDEYDAYADITRAGLQEEMRAQSTMTIPKNRIDLFAEAAGIPLDESNSLPVYVMTEEEEAWGKDFIQKNKGNTEDGRQLAVHVRSNDPKRTWHKDSLRAFLSLADKKGYRCFLFGWGDNRDEWSIKGTTLVFDYKLRQEAAILKACNLLVCPDSHMLHLGGALNMKIVSLFGSMPPACRINHYPNTIAVVNQKLSCLGCIYAQCSNGFYCMRSLSPDHVMEAVEAHLNTPKIDVAADHFIYTPQKIQAFVPEMKPIQL